MSNQHHENQEAKLPDEQEIEIAFRSDGTDLDADEIAALKAQLAGGAAVSPLRRQICLSANYRSELYQRLAAARPELFGGIENDYWRHTASSAMHDFLRQALEGDGIEVSDAVFNMLFLDFLSSRDFYLARLKRREVGLPDSASNSELGREERG